MSLQIDVSLFQRRFAILWNEWKSSSEKLRQLKALVIFVNDPDDKTLRGGQILQQWLFGYEFKTTIFVLTDDTLYCLSSRKKIDFLLPLTRLKENLQCKIVLLARNRDNESANYQTLIDAIKRSRSGMEIGVFMKDKPVGSFVEEFDTSLTTKFTKEGIDFIMSEICANRDSSELEIINNDSKIISYVYKQAKDYIYQVIRDRKSPKDSEFSEHLKNIIKQKEFHEKFASILEESSFEFSREPLVVSGGRKMNFDQEARSMSKRLALNSIVLVLQGKLDFYCCTIARTILLNPSESKKDTYIFANTVLDKLKDTIAPGKTLGSIYAEVQDFVRLQKPELLNKLYKCLGYISGINPFDKNSVLVEGSQFRLPQSFAITIHVGFQDLEADDVSQSKSRAYSIFIADTISYSHEGCSVITKNSRQPDYVTITFDDKHDQEDDEENSEDINNYIGGLDVNINTARSTRTKTFFNEKAALFKHQAELKKELYSRTNEKLKGMSPHEDSPKSIAKAICYKNIRDVLISKDVRAGYIDCDQKTQSIILPIFGNIYPIHVSNLKNLNISNSHDDRHTILRLNLNCPMSIYKSSEDQQIYHLKELHFKANNYVEGSLDSKPSAHLHKASNDIKDLQKLAKKSLLKKEDEAQNYKDFKLIAFDNCPRLLLPNVTIRPHTSSKTLGTLEAFKNGFAYTKASGERHVIPYNIIKVSIFQPCDDSSLITALHFRLSNFILIGSKKSEDVQFYTEAGELSYSLEETSSKRYKNDQAEELEEEQTNQNKKRQRGLFINFCKEVEARTGGLINFERPIPGACFTANPIRATVDVLISDNLFLSIIEWPSFILNLNDIELVYFERDIDGLKTCDMAVIFKDYTKKVTFLRSVIKDNMHLIQTTLDKHQIPFFSGIQALNWPKIMQTILEDPLGFAESHNWNFLSSESDDELDHSDQDKNSSSKEESEEDDEADLDDTESESLDNELEDDSNDDDEDDDEDFDSAEDDEDDDDDDEYDDDSD